MSAVALSLSSAVLWGCGNLAMGLAARRSVPRATVLVGFGTGLVGALGLLLVQQPVWSATTLGWGAAGGLAQGAGWLAFARALTALPLSLAAPATAACTVALLYVHALATGSAVAVGGLVGIALAVGAVALLSRTGGSDAPVVAQPGGLGAAGLAGALFALQALALAQAGRGALSLVLVGAAAGAVLVLLVTLPVAALPLAVLRSAGWRAAAGGAVILVGDLTYVRAVDGGAPLLPTVLSQLHPVVTAALAVVLLRERLTAARATGVVLAAGAVALLGAAMS